MMPRGREVEVPSDEALQHRVGDLPRPVGLHQDRYGIGHPDGIGHLEHGALGQLCRHQVLGHVAGHVAGRAVDLRGVLAGEGAPSVRAGAAVGVDDDLAPGQSGVAHGPAGDEAARGIDVEHALGAVEEVERVRWAG